MKIGFGYDVHRLVKGRKLILGGVTIPHKKGLLGHSDADVMLHALCDSILGAAGLRDIGHYFSNKDAKWKRKMDINLQRPSGKVKKIGNKESRIISDICHKTSRKIVDLAKEYDTNIAMERLSGLREAKINKKNKHWLQVFPFHNLQIPPQA